MTPWHGCNARSAAGHPQSKKKPPRKGGYESFRRGCLKGTIFVRRSAIYRKCEKLFLDCKYCNRMKPPQFRNGK